MSVREYISDFLLAKEIEEGCAKSTLRAYKYDLEMFSSVVPGTDVESIKQIHIRRFLGHLKQKEYTKKGLARKIACLKSFFRFLSDSDMIEGNPMKKIRSPRVNMTNTLPKFLTRQRIDELMEKLKSGDGLPRSIRDRGYVVVRLLYATMARVSEVCRLKVGDIVWEKGIIKLFGKGSKERWVPVDEETLVVLDEFIKRRPEMDAESPLLVNSRGAPLTPRIIQADFQKMKQIMGWGNSIKFTPHVLRHTGATHLRRAGMDISELQDLLGHASPNTTRIYAKNDISTLSRSYRAMHPLAKENN